MAEPTYRGWLVRYDPPPIPDRSLDWSAVHPDYDGPGDNRYVRGKTFPAVLREVDCWYQENCDNDT